CGSLNISVCPPTETDLPLGKTLVVVIYNPLGWKREQIIKVPVNSESLTVKDSDDNTVESQLVPLRNWTVNVGISSDKVALFSLFFPVSVPPFGFRTYTISKENGSRSVFSTIQTALVNESRTFEAGPGNLKMSFSSISGQLQQISNYRTG
ncbi:hypothetical protein KI387_036164, partial [Taxus chinensis]